MLRKRENGGVPVFGLRSDAVFKYESLITDMPCYNGRFLILFSTSGKKNQKLKVKKNTVLGKADVYPFFGLWA